MLQDFKSFVNQNSKNFGLNESVTIKKQITTIQKVLTDLEILGKKNGILK